jgi:23S rRNA (pseudouridine1915-N3)-methyltransferase
LRLRVIAVGRARRGPARDLFDDYAARIARLGPGLGFGGFELCELSQSRAATPAERIGEEGHAILETAGGARLCVLDERGDNAASTELAHWLGAERDAGTAEFAFAIGGPDGIAEEVCARAARTIAFGRATWPHLLARAMIAEQIYRVLTILGRHPYHRL